MAKGHSSIAQLLPHILRRTLAVSTSAVKQKHSSVAKSEWAKHWHNLERGRRIQSIDNSTPSPKFIQAINNPKLSRQSTSTIAQLRLNHIPLNSYLNRFHLVQSVHCPACGERNETVEHYLLCCPGYVHERWILKQKFGDNLTLTSLLGNEKAMVSLANFIDATQRFTYKTHTNGQANHPNIIP